MRSSLKLLVLVCAACAGTTPPPRRSAELPPVPPPPPLSVSPDDSATRAGLAADVPITAYGAMGLGMRGTGRGGLAVDPPSAVPERPGLGTTFAERRVSRVQRVAFERASVLPFASVALSYDDEAGVAAAIQHAAARGALAEAVPIQPTEGLTVMVVDESGRTLPAVRVGERVLVVGHSGRRYSLVVANHTPWSYEVVASVDGLDVLDGGPASYGKRGYLIGAYGTLSIEGYRTSLDDVAAFRFGTVAESYAALTGSSRNVGVIGMAFFTRRDPRPADDREVELRRTANPFPGWR